MGNSLGTAEKHESYGLIRISRRTSNIGVPMVGSSIKHREYISLDISTAVKRRNLHSEDFYADTEIVEINMSYSQFTEFVTSMNVGGGVPCTITHLKERRMKSPPFDDKKATFQKEFHDSAKDVGRRLDHIQEFVESLKDKKTITKADRETIANMIAMAKQDITSNLPFVLEQFDAQMDLSIKEAKGEIEGFALNKIMSAGRIAISQFESQDATIPALGWSNADGRGNQTDDGVSNSTENSRDDGLPAIPTDLCD